MGKRVVIVGAGIAGLTAAHELIERGFEVHVYERRSQLGGKASSRFVVSKATNQNGKHHSATPPPWQAGLPVEHGYRFFPSWYRHVIDTMQRIPYQRDKAELYRGKTVADNLVEASQNLLLWSNRPPFPLPTRLPNSLSQLEAAGTFFREFFRLGVTPEETLDFLAKLAEVSLADDVKHRALQDVRWWDFIDADSKSKAFQDLMRGVSETLIAARAEHINADTMGKLGVRALLDITSSTDRMLNGPTHQRFIEPWRTYLESRGVLFREEYELDTIVFKESGQEIAKLTFSYIPSEQARRLRSRLETLYHDVSKVLGLLSKQPNSALDFQADQLKNATESLTQNRNSFGALAETTRVLPNQAFDTLNQFVCELIQAASKPPSSDRAYWTTTLMKTWEESDAYTQAINACRKEEFSSASTESTEAEYFVFALPVEQMAYYVNRSVTLRSRAPELVNIISLADSTSWMAGIQFYLKDHLDLVRGHGNCIDSPWGITFVEQLQFWRDVSGIEADVKAVISVDIAEWGRPGRFVAKAAYNCDDDEIALEVWEQLKVAINDSARQLRLRDDMLRSRGISSTSGTSAASAQVNPGQPVRGIDYNLDDSIADIYDRKKQAFYERARSVALNREDGGSLSEPPQERYSWGPRLRYNVDPLLVNRVGTYKLRPEAATGISNLFLAGDYVKTETDLASMEGANESARLAVNALLDVAGSHEERCQVWRFDGSAQVTRLAEDLKRITLSGAVSSRGFQGALRAAGTAFGLVTRAAGHVLSGVEKRRQ